MNDRERLLPVGNPAGEDQQLEAIGAVQLWMLDLAVEDDQLLAEQGILGDLLGFSSREVGDYASNNGIEIWANQLSEGRLNQIGESANSWRRNGADGTGMEVVIGSSPVKACQPV